MSSGLLQTVANWKRLGVERVFFGASRHRVQRTHCASRILLDILQITYRSKKIFGSAMARSNLIGRELLQALDDLRQANAHCIVIWHCKLQSYGGCAFCFASRLPAPFSFELEPGI